MGSKDHEKNTDMGKLTLVTPPSFFLTQNKSFCLINLSKNDKDLFADAINKHMPKEDITLYVWDDNNFLNLDIHGNKEDAKHEKIFGSAEPDAKDKDYTWLLNACETSTTVVMNMDYSSHPLKVWSGYILTLAKTYFIHSGHEEAKAYSILNRNKIDDVTQLFSKIKKNMDSQ
jgi:hypothetical protein|tara:strand:- start:120 stop:638 length:519 start_codon:yes stop_codon:yes gene_type:complete